MLGCSNGTLTTDSDEACFNGIRTPPECCDGLIDGKGLAMFSPGVAFEKQPLRLHRRHPAWSDEQRLFEKLHEKASFQYFHGWVSSGRSVSVVMRHFKRDMSAANQIHALDDYLKAATRHQIPADGIVLDIGAAIGLFAIAVALQFPDARVYAVEPSPQNYRYLVWNIRENNVTSNVWPINAALRGESQPNELALRYSPTWPVATFTCPSLREEHCEFSDYIAPAITFAELHQALRRAELRWVKMDCEGCEWHVASDAGFLSGLLATAHLVMVEMHPQEIYLGHADAPSRLHAMLQALCNATVRPRLVTELQARARGKQAASNGALLCSAVPPPTPNVG